MGDESRVVGRCVHMFLRGTGFCPEGCDRAEKTGKPWQGKGHIKCNRCRTLVERSKLRSRQAGKTVQWYCKDEGHCKPASKIHFRWKVSGPYGVRHYMAPNANTARRGYKEWCRLTNRPAPDSSELVAETDNA